MKTRSYAALLFLVVLVVVACVDLARPVVGRVLMLATVDQVDQADQVGVVLAVKSGPARRRRIATGYWKSDDRRVGRGDVEPREVRVNVPVTLVERERWRELAKGEGMGMSEFVRHAVNEYTPTLPAVPMVPE